MEQLKSRLSIDAKVTIIYHRGDDEITIPTAWFGRQLFRIMDGNTSRVEWADRDFLIPVESLILDSVRFKPERGHWIEVTFIEPKGYQRFEVAAPDNEQPWRYSDPACRLYRIHTKEMVS